MNATSIFKVDGWSPEDWKLDNSEGTEVGRAQVTKTFDGDLQGTSIGSLIGAQSTEANATYVAMERVTGTLQGKTGSFVLAHSSTITENVVTSAMCVIVPGSGTNELKNISGTGKITVDADGTHTLELHYEIV